MGAPIATSRTAHARQPAPRLGLGANWRQFALLAAVTGFVGAMLGMERTVVPLLAEEEFGVGSRAAAVSFIAAFGLAKAVANLLAGRISEVYTRRSVLIAGWLIGAPVPLLLIWAPSWGWIIGANVLLGLNQGLAWSMTVNMKIDLAGPQRRGLALGLNEAAGYLSVAAAAYLTGVIAEQHGLRPEPFYLGIASIACGLALSVLFVKDTGRYLELEASRTPAGRLREALPEAFVAASWREKGLLGLNQAGFVNNMNDALAWGIFPLFFASRGLPVAEIGVLAAAYPLTWGALQTATGWASDIAGRTPMIAGGMLLQAAAISAVGLADGFSSWLAAVMLLGAGTAMVYPVLLAAVSDAVHPAARATYVGVYRFWRDAGAMAGAIVAGAAADLLGFETAIQVIATLTAASGAAVAMLSGRRTGG